MERPGLDGFVYIGLVEIDRFVGDMRRDVAVPSGIWNETTALERYLAYLSMLVDIALADMAMSAIHSNDIAVLMKARMLVEYANKAIYCNNHPDYALYFTTIEEAASILKKNRDGGVDTATVQQAEGELADVTARFPEVAGLSHVTLSKMMRENTRAGDPKRNDEYVWLYGAPSALMHGDPEGMRMLLPVDDEGRQHPTISLSDGHLNALMVDAGMNAIAFCGVFLARFREGEEVFANRLRDLACSFKSLCLKHTEGRDEESLIAIRAELEADGYPPATSDRKARP